MHGRPWACQRSWHDSGSRVPRVKVGRRPPRSGCLDARGAPRTLPRLPRPSPCALLSQGPMGMVALYRVSSGYFGPVSRKTVRKQEDRANGKAPVFRDRG